MKSLSLAVEEIVEKTVGPRPTGDLADAAEERPGPEERWRRNWAAAFGPATMQIISELRDGPRFAEGIRHGVEPPQYERISEAWWELAMPAGLMALPREGPSRELPGVSMVDAVHNATWRDGGRIGYHAVRVSEAAEEDIGRLCPLVTPVENQSDEPDPVDAPGSRAPSGQDEGKVRERQQEIKRVLQEAADDGELTPKMGRIETRRIVIRRLGYTESTVPRGFHEDTIDRIRKGPRLS